MLTDPTYFRYPFLRQGNTLEKRDTRQQAAILLLAVTGLV